ncbi:hypothetical protein CEXT_592851 [Caerostris extrusa]|uniref:Uncharacterized protein n=1 Tax=Caerostris extrusa TaxID=172846 RepID=A0AAV4UMI1_CAEEX|nr:hypothetical protein CEXT_592851 [Caerostris extrusa]
MAMNKTKDGRKRGTMIKMKGVCQSRFDVEANESAKGKTGYRIIFAFFRDRGARLLQLFRRPRPPVFLLFFFFFHFSWDRCFLE